jgi:glycosyltransferase involved in cell wall biosynthesis
MPTERCSQLKEKNSVPSGTRITMAIPSLLPLGGVERIRLIAAEEFLRRGFEVDLAIANEPSRTEGVVPERVRVIEFGKPRTRDFILPFARYLRATNPDAVIADIWPFTSACILAHRLAGSKARLMVSDHNPLSVQYAARGIMHRLFLRFSLAATYRLADACVGVSTGVVEDVSMLSGLGTDRFHVIHNPVKSSRSTPLSKEEEIKVWRGWEGPRLIAVGRLKKQKNYPLMLEALKIVNLQREVRLMILGVGELESELQRKVSDLKLERQVIFMGQVPDPEPYYHSAHLFVLTSDYEGFGNVIIEALACGLPVVSTDCRGGPREILQDGKWGRLVPVGDAEILSSTILDCLQNPREALDLRARAEDFSPAVICDSYLKLLFPNSCGLGVCDNIK